MENTLALMNSKNEGYRRSLIKVDQSSKLPRIACNELHFQFISLLRWNGTSGEEIEQLDTLEGQWRAALDKHKLRKRHVKQLEEDLQVHCVTVLTGGHDNYDDVWTVVQAMGRTLSSLKSDEAMLTASLEEKQNTLTQLNKDLEELKAKRERVNKQVT